MTKSRRKKGIEIMYMCMSMYISEKSREMEVRRNQAVAWSIFLSIEILAETEKLLNRTSKKKKKFLGQTKAI